MKYLKLSSLIVTVLFTSMSLYGQTEDFNNNVIFKQKKRSVTISKPYDSITLSKGPFAMDFYCKQYDEAGEVYNAVSVAVLADENDIGDISVGRNLNDIPYFGLGTGFAADKSGYTSIYINNEGRHYLYYKNEQDKRVNLVSAGSEMLLLEWEVAAFLNKETQEDIPMSELKNDYLYFVVLMDRNRNNIIDEWEVKVVKILFK